jgi:hypothetical protein
MAADLPSAGVIVFAKAITCCLREGRRCGLVEAAYRNIGVGWVRKM